MELWNEFEGNTTNESKFARAIDRIVPVLLNMKSNGLGWKENKIGYTQVFEVSSGIANGSSTLWHYVKEMLEKNIDTGLFYTREQQ